MSAECFTFIPHGVCECLAIWNQDTWTAEQECSSDPSPKSFILQMRRLIILCEVFWPISQSPTWVIWLGKRNGRQDPRYLGSSRPDVIGFILRISLGVFSRDTWFVQGYIAGDKTEFESSFHAGPVPFEDMPILPAFPSPSSPNALMPEELHGGGVLLERWWRPFWTPSSAFRPPGA